MSIVSPGSDMVANGRGQFVDRAGLPHLVAGTIATLDLAGAERQYREFFGFECARYAPGRMLVRDRRAKYMMESGDTHFFTIDVVERESIPTQQIMLNHWGIQVGTPEEVVRINKLALADPKRFRIAKALPISKMHGTSQFYFYDDDTNWWEIEYPGEKTNELKFSKGDWDAEQSEGATVVNPDTPISSTPADIVGPDAFLTHGTTDVIDPDASRLFYEEVLHLRSVRQFRIAQSTSGGGDFTIVGVKAGPRNAIQTPANRWVLLVDGREQVLAAHERATAGAERHGLLQVTDVENDHTGADRFLICNADSNWFEVSSRSADWYRSVFERGDGGDR